MEYTEWRNFEVAIKRAKEACKASKYLTREHLVGVNKMINLGKGAKKKVNDYHLSRYACYLIVKNADPRKKVVAH